jgi:hypothetical protein
MHRLILGAQNGDLVDHKDRNGLNNRRNNLRLCTSSQNSMNVIRKYKGKTSVFRGVHFHKAANKWIAKVYAGRVAHHLGSFVNEVDAAIAYDHAAKRLHGEFALVNFPEAAP